MHMSTEKCHVTAGNLGKNPAKAAARKTYGNFCEEKLGNGLKLHEHCARITSYVLMGNIY